VLGRWWCLGSSRALWRLRCIDVWDQMQGWGMARERGSWLMDTHRACHCHEAAVATDSERKEKERLLILMLR
jgi:hypothetical protein